MLRWTLKNYDGQMPLTTPRYWFRKLTVAQNYCNENVKVREVNKLYL